MRYFTVQELVRSVLLAVAYGLTLPLLRLVAEIVLFCPVWLLALPRLVYRRGRGERVSPRRSVPSRLAGHLTDFVFGLLAGGGLLLVLYVGTDGTVRLYVLLLTALSALVSQRFMGRPVHRAAVTLGARLYGWLVELLSWLLRPFMCLFGLVYRRALRPLYRRCRLVCIVWRLRHRLRRALVGAGRSLFDE